MTDVKAVTSSILDTKPRNAQGAGQSGPEELRALVEALEECRSVLAMLTNPNAAVSGLSIQTVYAQAVAAEAKARTALTRAESSLASPAGMEGWMPIERYDSMLPVLVGRPTDTLVYTPTTAFRDATGVMRVFRSPGGMTKLPFEPTHFLPLPAAPRGESE